MEKLYHYLKKISADYSVEKYGENYFFNAPPVLYNAAVVSFDPLDREATRTAEKIRKYCKRYGYIIFYTFHNLYTFGFAITTPENRTAAELYRRFSDQAAREFEEMQHEYYNTGRHNEINAAGLAIMDKYEKQYLKALKTA